MIIDLRSDTVTKPTPDMLEAMFNAEVGDDVFGEDPTVQKLESTLAAMFGKQAGLFCPTGTMSNQLAIRTLTQPGDEVICDQSAHIYHYEGGGPALHSGLSLSLIHHRNGIISGEDIISKIRPVNDWSVRSKLVVIENSCNMTGGNYYTLSQIKEISDACKAHHLKLHLDGARVFNVLAETGENPEAYGQYFDTIAIGLSKGLGAPAGSVLLGNDATIQEARRWRKVFGGGMRQSGYLAAAGLFALKNNMPLLKEDNQRAKQLGEAIQQMSFVKEMLPVHTNIAIFETADGIKAQDIVDLLKEKDIKAIAISDNRIRFVTHYGITDAMIEAVVNILRAFKIKTHVN